MIRVTEIDADTFEILDLDAGRTEQCDFDGLIRLLPDFGYEPSDPVKPGQFLPLFLAGCLKELERQWAKIWLRKHATPSTRSIDIGGLKARIEHEGRLYLSESDLRKTLAEVGLRVDANRVYCTLPKPERY